MKVYIIGTGYVGLVTATCLAELGHAVCAVDIDPDKIATLQSGKSPIYEKGLDELIKKNLENGRLRFKVDIGPEINDYEIAIIAVGTPERKVDGKADLYYVAKTAQQIAQHVDKPEFIVIGKSTVPVGTTRQIQQSLKLYNRTNTDFHIGSNPETLREGNAVHDFLGPDRIIIGGDEAAQEALLALYQGIDCPKVLTDTESAEMIKLAANFMLALRVSATNMLARVCDSVGADIEVVMEGVGLDGRIGPQFLKAGIGYGGSCFPKDVKNIQAIAEYHRLDTCLFEAVHNINSDQKKWFCNKVDEMALFTLRNKRIAVWGLAFKPETDDIREAPSLDVITWLLQEEAIVRAYDPVANVERVFGDRVEHCADMYDAVEDAEMLLIITEWQCFVEADLNKVKDLMIVPKIVDGRNIYNSLYVRNLGFEYTSIGRP